MKEMLIGWKKIEREKRFFVKHFYEKIKKQKTMHALFLKKKDLKQKISFV